MRGVAALALATDRPTPADIAKLPLLAQGSLARCYGLNLNRITDPFDADAGELDLSNVKSKNQAASLFTEPSANLEFASVAQPRQDPEPGSSDSILASRVLRDAEVDDLRRGGWAHVDAYTWRLRVCLARLMRRRAYLVDSTGSVRVNRKGYFRAAAFPRDSVMKRHDRSLLAGLERQIAVIMGRLQVLAELERRSEMSGHGRRRVVLGGIPDAVEVVAEAVGDGVELVRQGLTRTIGAMQYGAVFSAKGLTRGVGFVAGGAVKLGQGVVWLLQGLDTPGISNAEVVDSEDDEAVAANAQGLK